MERITDRGKWTSENGISWVLVEPSQKWLNDRQVREEASIQRENSRPLTQREALLEAVKLLISEYEKTNSVDNSILQALTDSREVRIGEAR